MGSLSALHLREGAESIGSGVVSTGLYGISFALYCFSARQLYHQFRSDGSSQQRAEGRRPSIVALLHMSLVISLAFILVIIDVRRLQVSFIDHGDFPGDGLIYETTVAFKLHENVARGCIGIVLEFLVLVIQIWRLWVVWSISPYVVVVVIFPVIFSLAYLGAQIYIAISLFHPLRITEKDAIASTLASEAAKFATNSTITVLILSRIIVVRRRSAAILGLLTNSHEHTSVIAMLIESFALDSIWTLGELIFAILNVTKPGSAEIKAGFLIFSEPVHHIRVLAYMLVIYRVISKRGWERETERRLTSLQWNRSEANTGTGISTAPASSQA